MESALESMLNLIGAELEDPSLHWQQQKVLNSALKHWDGLTVFVDNPLVPMDNPEVSNIPNIRQNSQISKVVA